VLSLTDRLIEPVIAVSSSCVVVSGSPNVNDPSGLAVAHRHPEQ